MEPQNTANYIPSVILSIFTSIIALISIKDVQVLLGIIASIIAIVSGISASVFYIYGALEKRKILKDNK